MFQSTLPARGATHDCTVDVAGIALFQSTLPRGERLASQALIQRWYECFNPRSREGSDRSSLATVTPCDSVSIHAPARGATLPTAVASSCVMRFNPRSRRGERPCHRTQSPVHGRCFNPRSREGSDAHLAMRVTATAVSIHAPARGATSVAVDGVIGSRCFNPRSREGSDMRLHGCTATCTMFQSTLPRGERPATWLR